MLKYAPVMNMKKKLRGSILLLLTTTIWGFGFIAQSVGMDSIGPFTFQAIRCALAVIFLFLCSFVMEHDPKASFAKWKNPALWKAGLICGVALFVASSLQQIGLVYTDAGKAGFLTAMYIVWVPVLGALKGERLPKTILISVVLAVIGLYLLSCVGTSGINKGDLYLMGCAIAFSVQIRCIDRFAGNLDGLRVTCLEALVTTVLSIPFMLLTETVDPSVILACWKPLCFSGILSMGVAYTLQVVGQQSLEPTTASLIMSMESVFAALGGWWLLNERMAPWEIGGCVLVFIAVVLSQLPADIFLRKKTRS